MFDAERVCGLARKYAAMIRLESDHDAEAVVVASAIVYAMFVHLEARGGGNAAAAMAAHIESLLESRFLRDLERLAKRG